MAQIESTPRITQPKNTNNNVKLPAAVSNTAEAIATAQAIKPETASVKVHYPQGASATEKARPQRVLIHVHQMHGPSALDDLSHLPPGARDVIKKYLPKAQVQLHSVLGSLTQKPLSSGIYNEGMTQEVAKYYNETLQKLREDAETIATLEKAFTTMTSKKTEQILAKAEKLYPEPRKPEVQEQIKALAWLKKRQQVREIVAGDPVLAVAIARQVSLYAAEDSKLHQENIRFVNAHPEAEMSDSRIEKITNRRDTHLVNTVGESHSPVSITVLGAGHDLKSEVDAWNKAHPNDLITLVEVEPTAITQFLAE